MGIDVNAEVSFEEIFERVWKWQEKTFDTSSRDACLGLKEELEELEMAMDFGDTENELPEISDCFHYLIYIIRKRGYTFEQTKEAIIKKLEINEKREWVAKGNGCYQHKS